MKGKGLEFFVGFITSAGCLAWIIYYIEESKFIGELRGADISLIALAVAIIFISYVIRGARWPLFFEGRNISFYNSFRCLIVGFFMNNMLPARIGEFIRAHVGGRVTRLSRALVLATVAGERLADGIVISFYFIVFFTFGATVQQYEDGRAIYVVCYLFAAAGLMTSVVLFFRKLFFRFLEIILGYFPNKMLGYSFKKLNLFVDGLEPMMKLKNMLPILAESLLIWGLELLAYYLVTIAFHQQMNLAGLSLFLAVVNFSSLIPAMPAGIGVIEALATLSLVKIGINKETALAMVATQHIIQIAVVGIPGAYYFYSTMGGRIPETNQLISGETV
ncbi:MAG: flippase-like domain-containing protein [Deltaproteobacteria bacterium]|nr:flippase-like domain-containing protein [Deltaproteobacteria bacterium]